MKAKIAVATFALAWGAGMGIPANAAEASSIEVISEVQLAEGAPSVNIATVESVALAESEQENIAVQQQAGTANVGLVLLKVLGTAALVAWGSVALVRRFRENCEF